MLTISLVLLVACGEKESLTHSKNRSPRLEIQALSPLGGNFEYYISDVAWMDDQRLVVGNHHDKTLIIRSSEARDTTIGRSGSGPGEFSSIGTLLASDQGLLVTDPKLGRLTQLSDSGDYIRSIGVPGTILHLLSWNDDFVSAIWVGFDAGEMTPVLGTLDLRSGDLIRSTPLFGSVPSLRNNAMGVEDFPNPHVAGARRPDGSMVIGGGRNQYLLSVVDSLGAPQFEFGRTNLEPEMRSQREIERHLQSIAESTRNFPNADAMMEQWRKLARETPKPFFEAKSGLQVDQAGRTWVTTRMGDSDSTYVDLFSPKGAYLKTFTLRDHVLYLAPRLPFLAVGVIRRGGEDEGMHGIDVYRVVE